MSGIKLPLGIGDVQPLDVPEAWAPEPGAAQRRDDALAADLRQGMPAPLPPAGPSEGEQRAAEDVDQAIAEAREVITESSKCFGCCGAKFVKVGDDYQLCATCGGSGV